jgi:hypothetical protein
MMPGCIPAGAARQNRPAAPFERFCVATRPIR